jgi:hypothetical protein
MVPLLMKTNFLVMCLSLHLGVLRKNQLDVAEEDVAVESVVAVMLAAISVLPVVISAVLAVISVLLAACQDAAALAPQRLVVPVVPAHVLLHVMLEGAPQRLVVPFVQARVLLHVMLETAPRRLAVLVLLAVAHALEVLLEAPLVTLLSRPVHLRYALRRLVVLADVMLAPLVVSDALLRLALLDAPPRPAVLALLDAAQRLATVAMANAASVIAAPPVAAEESAAAAVILLVNTRQHFNTTN